LSFNDMRHLLAWLVNATIFRRMLRCYVLVTLERLRV
jgi:hypothetical protein